MKPSPPQTQKATRLLSLITLALAVSVLALSFSLLSPSPFPDLTDLLERLDRIEEVSRRQPVITLPPFTAPGSQKKLIFYNRPPKTGSTTVRIAMKKALADVGLKAAKCFNMIEWNEMALKTIVNHRDVDFYGCHTRMTKDRHSFVSNMRAGNVTFVTNTRNPENIILSAYLQANRDRSDLAGITDDAEIQKEVELYKQHVEAYPIDALYHYHGADVPLVKCPVDWIHTDAMRRIAERYEAVIDLERPVESAVMIQAITGLRPDFTGRFNERTQDTSGKMLSTLKNIDTSHKTCGNELVHNVLMQQFNIIKDRLMQNRCFDEDSGGGKYCDKATLKLEELKERTRSESYAARAQLVRLLGE